MPVRSLSWFGTADGPLRKLSPEGRLTTGALILLSSVVSLPRYGYDALFSLSLCAVFLSLCSIPFRLFAKLFFSVTAVLLVSFLIFALPISMQMYSPAAEPNSISLHGALVAGALFLKMMSTAFISLGLLATVTYYELYQAAAKLPLPELPKQILMNILHQTSMLISESARLKDAIVMRSDLSGFSNRLSLARQFPQTWLSKLFARSGNIADAMEIRGQGPIVYSNNGKIFSSRDIAWISIAASLLFILVIISLLKMS